MLEFDGEPLFDLSSAIERLAEATGLGVHRSTVYRWVTRGVGGIRLGSVRLGGRVYTSEEAIRRFGSALTAHAETLRSTYQSKGGAL